jgi:nucleotide-binding universal stress UspA family protein
MDPNLNAALIVVGIDGSPGAYLALDWAIEEARHRDARLRLLMATSRVPALVHSGGSEVAAPPPDGPGQLWIAVDRAVRALGADRVDWACTGCGAVDLLAAPVGGADLVVVAAHGGSGFPAWRLGSTAQRLSWHAAVPLVVVRRSSGPRCGVVVGIDDPDRAPRLLRFAYRAARDRDAEVRIVHAISPVDPGGAPADLAVAVATVADEFPGVPSHLEVFRSAAVAALVASSLEAELLVIGRRTRPAPPDGHRTGRAVLHRSHCPVAVIP